MTANYTDSGLLDELSLGKQTEYQANYNPELLQPVPRSLNRDDLNLGNTLPFLCEDLWTGYELSWLNSKGKPVVAIAEFTIPATSPNLVESKSFKLYLNSFNQSRFDNWQTVEKLMVNDLSACAGQTVKVKLMKVTEVSPFQITDLPGENIDDIDIEVTSYDFDNQLLKVDDERVSETINSHLLKSNCLITSQPDWASIVIDYDGKKINHASLLEYLISFRMHNEFHEQCVERIFCDIQALCEPVRLTVYARYTRRGGLDINPFRSTESEHIPWTIRTNRQ